MMTTETQRHRALLPWWVGESAKRRLMAPLPAAAWRDSLIAITDLGLSAAELDADWLPGVALQEVEAAFAASGLRPIALHATVDQALEAGSERLGQWATLGLRYWIVDECDGSESTLRRLDNLAAGAGLTALLANHAGGWPDAAELGRVAEDARYPHIEAYYDPAAAVARKRHPFLAEMMAGPLKRAVRIVRLRDALFAGGGEVLPDLGNAELREVVSALEARSYAGWYALSDFGEGPYRDRLAAVHAAVTAMLDQL